MALDNTPLPYGIRDIKITPYLDAAGTQLAPTSIDLPNARTLSFSDSEEFQELRGDDRVVATHGNGTSCSWDMESGGLPFEAFRAMAGGTISESGQSPAGQKIFAKKVTDQRPYFKVEGQAISDSGGDIHVELHRCKATGELSGEFKDGEFFLTSASGVALALASGALEDEIYRFVYNEAVTPIPGSGARAAITSITPSGAAAGDTVTIVGEGFNGATEVLFGDVAAVDLAVVSSTVITVKLPAGDAGAVDVTVSTPVGLSAAAPYTRA